METNSKNGIVVTKDLKKYFKLRKEFLKYSYVHAVDEVSFKIEEGRVLGLAGESGCGKTTFGKLLVKLLEPTSGSIFFEGKNITNLRGKDLKDFRRNTQMIFQNPYESLNPRFTIFDSVAEPLIIQKANGEEEEKVYKVLEDVGLIPQEEYLFRYPHELSGGQRQRVAIARAIVTRPKFIVADEPTSMLDVSLRAGMMNLMLDLKEKYNLTYLFITHDLTVARYMCEKMGIMYLGRVVEYGFVEELIKNPLHPYTKALMSAVPDPSCKRGKPNIVGQISTPIDIKPGCRFAPRCPYAKDICKEAEPESKEVEREHFVSCYLI